MKKFLLLSAMMLASCAHQVESASDLTIGESYPLLSAVPEATACRLTVSNIVTMKPTRQGIVPVEAFGETTAYVCGAVDCSAVADKRIEGTDWFCGGVELLMKPLPKD